MRYPHLVIREDEDKKVSNTLGNKKIDLPKLHVECDPTPYTISLRWVPNTDESFFKITIWEKGITDEYSNDIVPTTENFTIRGLKYDTEYVVIVTGFKRVVLLGVETRSSGFITVKTKKPNPPTGFKCTESGCDYAVLECLPYKHPGIVYQVRYRKEGSGFVNGNSSLTPKIKIEGLDHGSQYSFQIRILSKLGRREGEWSEPISIKTSDN